MSNILSILNEIKNNTTEVKRKEILVANDSPLFRKVLELALSPNRRFYVKKIEKPVEGFTSQTSLDDALDLLVEWIESGKITGNAAYDFVNELLLKLSADDAEVFHRVIQKNLLCDLGFKSVNAVYKGFIPTFPYMRCALIDEKYTSKFNSFIVQEKMDGMYASLTPQGMFSRSGKELDFGFECVEGYVIIGELLCFDKEGNVLDRQTNNGLLNRLELTDDELNSIKLVAWDCVPDEAFWKGKYDVCYNERLSKLKEIVEHNDRIKLIETIEVESADAAIAIAKQYVTQGKEGIVLKDGTKNFFKDGTSNEQLKIKNVFEVELKIVGFNEAEKFSSFAGTLGSLICESSDGQLKCKVSGMDFETREKIWNNQSEYLNKILTVAANKVSQNKQGEWSLYLPRFIEIRTDKDEADTLERIIAQDKGRV